MTPERWARVKEIFSSVQEKPEAGRDAFLAAACGADTELREQVQRLLREQDHSELERPVAGLRKEVSAPLAPGSMLSHYRVEEKLGEGGMGVVYKARDSHLKRFVALKVLPPEKVADAGRKHRFVQEARAASALNHPNIVTVYDIDQADGVQFIAMEYVEGRTLDELIGRKGLKLNEALQYSIQVADALAKAHAAGIVHRDLKPGNVMVSAEGRVKVLDFGLAKLTEGAAVGVEESTVTEQVSTESGLIVGTLSYMSPEQAEGKKVDARSDIFSFGSLLYEMVSGRRAFRGETMGETLAAVIALEPAPLKEAPSEVARIVGKMLAKKREDRYQSAEEVLDGLRAAAQPGIGLMSRRLWLTLAAAVLIFAAVVAGLNVRRLRTRLIVWMRAPAPPVRLAVLPFVNLSGDLEQEYLSDGLTQEMIAQLGRLHPQRLSVIARTSVMRYKKSDKSIDQVGRELGVGYILEGSVRREAGRVRITAELIQVRSQTQLWAQSFERELAGILALQSEVAKKVAGSLALKLLPAEQARLAGVRPVNTEAYEAYLRGRSHWYEITPGGLDSAQRYFERALQKDPDYAPAYAGIAEVWSGRQQMGLAPSREAVPRMMVAARKALELDNTLAEVHHTLAVARTWSEWDWSGAESSFRRAIEIDPNYPDARAYYSHFLMIMGRPEEAIAQIERALELDPFNSLFHALYAMDLNFAHRYDDALTQLRDTLSTAPDHPVARSTLRVTYHHKAMYKEAFEDWKAAYAAKGDTEIVGAMSRGYLEGGYPAAMRRAAETLATRPRSAARPWQIATLYVRAGEYREAIGWFEKAYEERDPNMPYLSVDPLFDGLRGDPRFRALLRKMNLPQ